MFRFFYLAPGDSPRPETRVVKQFQKFKVFADKFLKNVLQSIRQSLEIHQNRGKKIETYFEIILYDPSNRVKSH